MLNINSLIEKMCVTRRALHLSYYTHYNTIFLVQLCWHHELLEEAEHSFP